MRLPDKGGRSWLASGGGKRNVRRLGCRDMEQLRATTKQQLRYALHLPPSPISPDDNNNNDKTACLDTVGAQRRSGS